MTEKICAKCKQIKNISEFGKKKATKSGLQYNCKVCNGTIQKFWPSNSTENRRLIDKKHVEKYPDSRSKKMKRYRNRWPEKAKEQSKRHGQKQLERPEFYLRSILRRRLGRALKNKQKAGSAVRDLGCSIADLTTYLEKQFLPNMTWDNWGLKGWHIDHIKPLASFDLSDRTQFLQACHYTNLRPLWATDNLRKGAKLAA